MKIINKIHIANLLGTIVLLAAVIGGFAQTVQKDEPRELLPNQTTEREMTGAQTHRYQFELKANEFFQVRVEQKGVDVALKLTEAVGGKVLAMMDSPNGKEGFETLTFVAEKAGGFILEISGFDPKAGVGEYKIGREELRIADEKDTKRIEVEKKFVQAILARNSLDNSQRATVLPELRNALAGWIELKDSYLAQLTNETIAYQLIVEGQEHQKIADVNAINQALAYFEEAHEIFSKLQNKEGEIIALDRLGTLNYWLQENRKSQNYFDQAFKISKAINSKQGIAISLLGLARIDQSGKNIEYLQQAKALAAESGAGYLEKKILIALTENYNLTGNLRSALLTKNEEILKRGDLLMNDEDEIEDTLNTAVIELTRLDFEYAQKLLGYVEQRINKTPIWYLEVKYRKALVSIYSLSGKTDEAFEELAKGEAICKKVGSKSLLASLLIDKAYLYSSLLGDKQSALNVYQQALKLFKESGDKTGEARVNLGIGETYSDFGEYKRANFHLEQARSLSLNTNAQNLIADVLDQAGDVYSDSADLSNALGNYERALEIYVGTKNYLKQVETLTSIAGIYNDYGDYWKANEFLYRAESLRRDQILLDNRLDLGLNIARLKLLMLKGDFSQAVSYAQEVNKTISSFDRLALLFLAIEGLLYSGLGNKQEAINSVQIALARFKKINNRNRKLEAQFYFLLGSIHEGFAEYQVALQYFEQSLNLANQIGDYAQKIESMSMISSIYQQLGKESEKSVLFEEAIKLAIENGSKRQAAERLLQRADYYSSINKKEKSLKDSERVLQLYREERDELKVAEVTFYISLEKNEAEESLTLAERVYGVAVEKGNLLLQNTFAEYLAQLHSQLGNKVTALGYYWDLLSYCRDVSNRRAEAEINLKIGKFFSNKREDESAIDFYHQAVRLASQVQNPVVEAKANSNLMYAWIRLKNPQLAILYGKQSVNKYQGLRQTIQGLDKETQKSFLATIENTYRKLADLLITEGRFAQAEIILAILKEQEYFDFVRRDKSEIEKLGERVPLSEREKALIARYSQLADKITEIGQEFTKLDDKKRQLSRSNQELSADEKNRYAELEKQLNDANAAFKLFLEKELASEIGKEKREGIEIDRNLQEKLRKWGEGTVALYTVAGEDRYRVILTTPTTQIDGKYEIKIADLNKKVFEFRASLQNPAVDPRPLGKELYDILIKPVEKELKQANAKTLVWSLDGSLRYIPLAALSPDGKKYLIEDYQSVIITPKTRDDLTNSDANWQALGLGVSEAQEVANPDDNTKKMSFSSLPGTERELLAIIKSENATGETGVLFGRRFMNKDFTAANFKDALTKETSDGKRKYNIVHIASHFSLGSNWSNSFLLLGNGEILSLEEINNSATISFGDVELITLSACNTGFTADDTNGKEIDSLATVIQTKSGKSVLATLWSVADESTALVMSEFYRLRQENPNISKAEAMQKAQVLMIQGKLKPSGNQTVCRSGVFTVGEKQTAYKCDTNAPFAHPFYWSPFVLIGNWR